MTGTDGGGRQVAAQGGGARAEFVRGQARYGAVLGEVLELIEDAASASTSGTAVGTVRARLAEVDDVGRLRMLAAVLAVEAVWHMPAAEVEADDRVEGGEVRWSDRAIVSRQRQLRTWVGGRRRAALRMLARALPGSGS